MSGLLVMTIGFAYANSGNTTPTTVETKNISMTCNNLEKPNVVCSVEVTFYINGTPTHTEVYTAERDTAVGCHLFRDSITRSLEVAGFTVE